MIKHMLLNQRDKHGTFFKYHNITSKRKNNEGNMERKSAPTDVSFSIVQFDFLVGETDL